METSDLHMSNDKKIADWIINFCIGIAVVAALLIERYPQYWYATFATVVAATAISLGTFGVVSIRERKRAASAEPAADYLAELFARTAIADPVNLQQLFDGIGEDRNSVRYFRSRWAQHYTGHHSLHSFARYKQSSISGPIKLEPTSERYVVVVGAIRIEVDGDNTKIIVAESKNVSIDHDKTAVPSELPPTVDQYFLN